MTSMASPVCAAMDTQETLVKLVKMLQKHQCMQFSRLHACIRLETVYRGEFLSTIDAIRGQSGSIVRILSLVWFYCTVED